VLPHVAATLTDVGVTVQAVGDLVADTRGVLGTSLQVQCLTLRHLESLDAKTAGPLPAGGRPLGPAPAGCGDGATASP
jgi:hypothetical protein